jgi:hypothetical protein
LFFAFVLLVIKFPTGFFFFSFFFLSSQEFHPFRKMFPWGQQVNKQTLLPVSLPQSWSSLLRAQETNLLGISQPAALAI